MVALAELPSLETFTSIARGAPPLDAAVKFKAETFALLTVAVWLVGLKVNPDFVGVTV
jgi:hypothetical protein